VSDLHGLLYAAGEKGPFVLAGASIGGIYIRAYQFAYPQEVAALVFSNSAGRVGMALPDGKGGLLWDLTEEALRSAFPRPATDKGSKPANEGEPFDRLPTSLQKVRLWLDVRNWEKHDPAKATADSLLSWRKEFLREFAETEDPEAYPLGKLPVIVVSSNAAATDAERRTRTTATARLDHLSTNSTHIVAKGSGHEIHLYQPKRVIEAIALVRLNSE
jgi:pimeloyl-ACP methyl ester carboxylesterase